MKTFQLNKVESYYIQANTLEEAEAKLNDLDNSSAHKVEVQAVWSGANNEH